MAIVRAMPGHAMEVIPTASGRRFRLVCSCGAFGKGVNSPTQATEREAIRKGVWHLQKIEQKMRADGIEVRPSTQVSQRSA